MAKYPAPLSKSLAVYMYSGAWPTSPVAPGAHTQVGLKEVDSKAAHTEFHIPMGVAQILNARTFVIGPHF